MKGLIFLFLLTMILIGCPVSAISAEEWYDKGNSFLNLGNNEEAINAYDQAIQINPNFFEAWSSKGLALSNLGKNEEAIEDYDQALQINPEYADAWLNKGVTLTNLGKIDEAIEAFDQVLEINPEYADAWSNKGVVLTNLGRNEEAIEAFDQALQMNPNIAEAWSSKGAALTNLGKNDEAIEVFDQALQINPEYIDALNNKGVALTNLGKNDEAIEVFDQALQIDSENADAWLHKGVALTNLGKNDEAIEAFDQVLEINPEYAAAWSNKGAALSNLGKNNEAIEAFDQALQINPDIADAWLNKGIVLTNLGRNEEAIEAYDQVLQINPDYYEAWNNVGNSFLNLFYLDKESAINAYNQALQINPEYADAWYNKGLVLQSAGKIEEAVNAFDQLLQIDPNYPDAKQIRDNLLDLLDVSQLTLGQKEIILSDKTKDYLSLSDRSSYPSNKSIIIFDEPHYDINKHLALFKGLESLFEDNPNLASQVIFLSEGTPSGEIISLDSLSAIDPNPTDNTILELLKTYLITGYMALIWKNGFDIPIIGMEDDDSYNQCISQAVNELGSEITTNSGLSLPYQSDKLSMLISNRNEEIIKTITKAANGQRTPIVFVGRGHVNYAKTDDEIKAGFTESIISGLEKENIGYYFFDEKSTSPLLDYDNTLYNEYYIAQNSGDMGSYLQKLLDQIPGEPEMRVVEENSYTVCPYPELAAIYLIVLQIKNDISSAQGVDDTTIITNPGSDVLPEPTMFIPGPDVLPEPTIFIPGPDVLPEPTMFIPGPDVLPEPTIFIPGPDVLPEPTMFIPGPDVLTIPIETAPTPDITNKTQNVGKKPKIIKISENLGRNPDITQGEDITIEQAVEIVKNGGNVYTDDEKTAIEIAKQVGKGNNGRIVCELHGQVGKDGRYLHYHFELGIEEGETRPNRVGGHIFFGLGTENISKNKDSDQYYWKF